MAENRKPLTLLANEEFARLTETEKADYLPAAFKRLSEQMATVDWVSNAKSKPQ